MTVTIKPPETPEEFAQYYNLRWRILRAPWDQPEGSEKDELEDHCYHLMACDDSQRVIGVGRVQFNNIDEAQIRYMAVEPACASTGIGRKIVSELEAITLDNDHDMIVLDAREPAVGFYEKLGYEVKEKTYLLFDCIQHYRMQKIL